MTATENQLPSFGRLARRTLSTFIGALQNRAELFAVEFEEENNRLLRVTMFGVAAMFFAMTSVLLLTAVVIFLVPDAYRVWAALGFAVLYLVAAAVSGLTVKKLITQTPFVESLNQIKKDMQLLEKLK